MTPSRIPFTKMHGAGNDFVVLNNLDGHIAITSELVKKMADRHFGAGADQVLIVEPPENASNHFKYRIFNADGQEVQQCGNGARCFAQFVLEKKLTSHRAIRVETLAGVIEPEWIEQNWVRVNMGPVVFDPARVPFNAEGLQKRDLGKAAQYQLPVDTGNHTENLWVSVASMGNPHVVLNLSSPVSDAFVQHVGTTLESHPRFPERVNVGFMHIIDRNRMNLRVFERGAGETLACGTGACAAATCGIAHGLLSNRVTVVKRGGTLTIEWDGDSNSPVWMEGPAVTVYEGEFYL